MPPPNPSFTLVVNNVDAPVTIRGEGHHPKNPEAPLMRTVYYTYHEANFSFTYPFDVVDHGVKAVKVDAKQPQSDSKVAKLLDCLINTWNRRWKRSKGSGKDKSSSDARS